MAGPRFHFGRPDPTRLDRRGRIDALRRLAGALQADAAPDRRWLGEQIGRWLREGGDLDAVLGVRPRRGCTVTPQRSIEREYRDRLLLRLAAACGSDREALAILRGDVACPPEVQEAVAELRELGAAVGHDAITRARNRLARHRR